MAAHSSGQGLGLGASAQPPTTCRVPMGPNPALQQDVGRLACGLALSQPTAKCWCRPCGSCRPTPSFHCTPCVLTLLQEAVVVQDSHPIDEHQHGLQLHKDVWMDGVRGLNGLLLPDTRSMCGRGTAGGLLLPRPSQPVPCLSETPSMPGCASDNLDAPAAA